MLSDEQYNERKRAMAGSVGSEDGDVGFQIAPMVDVVFVLMLFFMASAGMQVVEKELGINLPSQATPKDVVDLPKTPIVIEIGADGQVKLNAQNYDTPTDKQLPQLRGRMEPPVFGEQLRPLQVLCTRYVSAPPPPDLLAPLLPRIVEEMIENVTDRGLSSSDLQNFTPSAGVEVVNIPADDAAAGVPYEDFS